MLSLKIAATGLAVAALAWLAIQSTRPATTPLVWQAALGGAFLVGVVTAIIAGLFAIWG